ncbi:MAG: hypothetical protein DI570_07740 [Phenylobacterium zucineum]|nr:MAG: hypothetical protein DI570_07740 [Phenylobacterium zucineum]
MRRAIPVLAAFVLALAGRPAAAQDARVYVPGGDGGRYVKLLDPKTRVAGHTPAAVQGFRAAMGQVIAQLDAMPQVNSPPPGICHQLGSWIEMHGALDAKVLAGQVEVMRPLEYRNGRCIRTNNALVMLGLNQTSDLVERNRAVVTDAEGREGRHWHVLPTARAEPGRIELMRGAYRVIVFTRRGTPLFVPVSAERFLGERVRRAEAEMADGAARQAEDRITAADIERFRREERPRRIAEFEEGLRPVAGSFTPQKLAEMRRSNIEGLDLAEQALRERLRLQQQQDARARPADPQLESWRRQAAQARGRGVGACFAAGARLETLDLSGACGSGQAVVELNPAYFDARRPGDIQLLTVTTSERADAGSEPSRRAIWEALDFGRLAALVR